ncbi:MAG: non-canonical purine NTP pyrophosphatase, partial [Aquificota bacterium]|nr:non-canonical purine NTP pyrophosphatase [Aquificota bacterium]
MAVAIVYLVTGNLNKLIEAREAVKGSCIRLEQASVDKVEIQSDRLEYIALYAARQAFRMLGRP